MGKSGATDSGASVSRAMRVFVLCVRSSARVSRLLRVFAGHAFCLEVSLMLGVLTFVSVVFAFAANSHASGRGVRWKFLPRPSPSCLSPPSESGSTTSESKRPRVSPGVETKCKSVEVPVPFITSANFNQAAQQLRATYARLAYM